jgi:hypothetical protein
LTLVARSFGVEAYSLSSRRFSTLPDSANRAGLLLKKLRNLMRRFGLDWNALSAWLVRVVLGLVLLFGAGLKAKQLLGESVPIGFGENLNLTLIIGAEIAIGVWLLSGQKQRASWWVVLLLFVAFGGYSSILVVRGASSCGCFGETKVEPKIIFLVDLGAVVLLLLNRPALRQESNDRQNDIHQVAVFHKPNVFQLVMTFCVSGFVIAVITRAVVSGQVGSELNFGGDIEIAEPMDWIGLQFRLLEYIDIGKQLSKGQWTVLLYHHDCPKCQNVIKIYRQALRNGISVRREINIALVEVPPFEESDESVENADAWLHGRFIAKKDWFIPTPVSVKISDGVVTEVSQDEMPSPPMNLARTAVESQ